MENLEKIESSKNGEEESYKRHLLTPVAESDPEKFAHFLIGKLRKIQEDRRSRETLIRSHKLG